MNGLVKAVVVGTMFQIASAQSYAQGDFMAALNSEACKKAGLAAATATNLRDNGATEEVSLAVMNAGIPEQDSIRPLLPKIVRGAYQFKDLSLHAHRMYWWVECANQSRDKKTKSLETLAPELKKCQALSNSQTQIDCMASVVNET